jgi:hypothetical protein
MVEKGCLISMLNNVTTHLNSAIKFKVVNETYILTDNFIGIYENACFLNFCFKN